MLSKKVTYAIIVLNELYCCHPNNRGRRTLLKSTLMESCELERVAFRQVVLRLYEHKYIDIVGSSVVLNCDPQELTVYHLFTIFHGGVPLGENTEQDYHRLDYYSDPKFPFIVHLELDLKEVSKEYLDRIKVTSLRNRKNTNRKK